MLVWGATRRPRLLRHPVGAQRRRHPRLRRLLPGEGRHRPEMGADLVIDRTAEGYRFWKRRAHPGPEGMAAARASDPRAHRRRRRRHRLRTPRPGNLRRLRLRHQAGGTIVTCASTSGYLHAVRQPLPLDEPQAHRRLPLRELPGAWEANRLIAKALIHPTLSKIDPLAEVGQAAYDVHRNLHQGKVGVLSLAPTRASASATTAKREQPSTPSTASAGSERCRPEARPGAAARKRCTSWRTARPTLPFSCSARHWARTSACSTPRRGRWPTTTA